MFTKNETECIPFKTAQLIIDKNLLFSDNKLSQQHLKDLFTAGEEVATELSFSNSIKVQYFYLLLKAYSSTPQEQVKEIYKALIQFYRKACSPLVNQLISKEVSELKQQRQQNEMISKLCAVSLSGSS